MSQDLSAASFCSIHCRVPGSGIRGSGLRQRSSSDWKLAPKFPT